MKLQQRVKNKLKRIMDKLLDNPKNHKEEMLRIAFRARKAWKIEGNYFEFGVYKGKTFIPAYHLGQQYNLESMKFFAFDSFEGLPQPTEIEGNDRFYASQYACSLNQFKNILQNNNVNLEKVTCIEGFYDKSLTKEIQQSMLPMKASIVWIDCDLYESTQPVLEFILPFLQNGTIICFDDWFSYAGHPLKGEIRATSEWLQKYPNIKLIDYKDFGAGGKSFLVQLESIEKKG